MKFWVISGFILLVLSSCGSNVEELQINPCNEPVVHEILWQTDTNEESASLTINTGDTVRWIWNEDDMPHDVSSTDTNAPADFGSEIMTGLEIVYEYTFNEDAVFNYRCSVHPTTMFGTITVIDCEEN